MIPLLVWLAGCVFGCWLIVHEGYTREAIAFLVCGSVMLWMVGGLLWLGRKLQTGAAARMPRVSRGVATPHVQLDAKEREAMKKAAASQSAEQSS